jgi:hypothetical protein
MERATRYIKNRWGHYFYKRLIFSGRYMMRIVRGLISLVVVLFGVFIVGGFFIPAEWTVSRSIVIHAGTEKIYPLVNNFKEWEKWSVWNTARDATLKYTYEGAKEGVGAKQTWTSEKMGNGGMQMTAASQETGVAYDLAIDMGHMQSTLHGEIAFVAKGDETTVTWTDKSNAGKSFVQRWMGLLVKPMLGKDMNTSLEHLKALAEKQ